MFYLERYQSRFFSTGTILVANFEKCAHRLKKKLAVSTETSFFSCLNRGRHEKYERFASECSSSCSIKENIITMIEKEKLLETRQRNFSELTDPKFRSPTLDYVPPLPLAFNRHNLHNEGSFPVRKSWRKPQMSRTSSVRKKKEKRVARKKQRLVSFALDGADRGRF